MFLPFAQLAKHGESESNYMETKVLADRGLYAIVRHPQYLGYILLFAGFALLSQHWISFVIAAGGVATLYTQAVDEERFCQGKFGRAYDDYMARVPRFNLILGLWRFFNGED
jgi:protein-S-isoprenylcysteine O-methyltransferase Ste14